MYMYMYLHYMQVQGCVHVNDINKMYMYMYVIIFMVLYFNGLCGFEASHKIIEMPSLTGYVNYQPKILNQELLH